jgi:F0F1-type ATP synthase membrane subunit c/vacuolar-type H+-ATPase subunit K
MEIEVETVIKIAAYTGGGIAMGLGAVGAAIGEGYTAARANLAVSRNPEISDVIFKNMLVGQAVAESASIFALVIAILLLFMNTGTPSMLKAAAFLGAGLSMGFGAIGSGIGSGYPGGEACYGISQQPAAASQLTTNMLVGSAVCQTPAIFSMVVALMLIFIDFGNAPLTPTWAAFVGAGLSMGLAAIGSGYGGGLAAGASCEGIARTPQSVASVTTIMLVGQAVSQTPSIFGLLISFILMFKSFPESSMLATPMALLGAGLCMGFGGIGPGIGNGMAAEGAVRWVARNVEHAGELMRIMLVGQAVSQSTAIYSMVVSLVLIFVL